MKNQVRFPFLSLFVIALLLSVGCKGDEKILSLGEQLVGEWEAFSYTIDGTESFDDFFDEFIMKYENYENGEGDFEWDITLVGGSDASTTGTYSVDEEGKELTLDIGSSYEIDVNGDNLTLTYNGGGDLEIVKAKRQ